MENVVTECNRYMLFMTGYKVSIMSDLTGYKVSTRDALGRISTPALPCYQVVKIPDQVVKIPGFSPSFDAQHMVRLSII